jgi:hypothetical protein
MYDLEDGKIESIKCKVPVTAFSVSSGFLAIGTSNSEMPIYKEGTCSEVAHVSIRFADHMDVINDTKIALAGQYCVVILDTVAMEETYNFRIDGYIREIRWIRNYLFVLTENQLKVYKILN